MTDDLDIEALLEAPFKREEAREGRDGRSHDNIKQSNGGERRRRSRSRSRRHGRSPRRRPPSRSRSRSRDRGHNERRRDYSDKVQKRYSPERRTRSPEPPSAALLSESQRDRRTVFCRQLAQRLESWQLKEFCEEAGRVRDAKVVYDKISRKSKGVAYVEFYEEESVPLAVALTGRKLLGIPIIVELTETEKNRQAEEAAAAVRLEKVNQTGKSMEIYISNLHPTVGEADLRRVFEPFGQIILVQISREDSSRSTAIIRFRELIDTRQAAEKMNGFELAGRPLRLQLRETLTSPVPPNNINKDSVINSTTEKYLEDDFDGTTNPMEQLLKMAREASHLKTLASSTRPSPCVLLQHMYDPATETDLDWAVDIAEETREECSKFGRVEHIKIPKTTEGDVFVRFGSNDSAQAAVASLNGRWFGGRQIVALFIPLKDYLEHFPQP